MSETAKLQSVDPINTMRSIIQKIATGPELSKDISLEEARSGMRLILEKRVDPVQSAIYLIALRMKRETDDENIGVLDAIREMTTIATASVDEVVDIADPYDGYLRNLPASPFVPVVLAECGVPAVIHGVDSVGPKYGVTHRKVFQAMDIPVDLSSEEAVARINDPDIGWTYIDQKTFCPSLCDLVELRTLIVKRPVLTTVEVLAGPIRGEKKTHLVTGYVHKPYARLYALLARHVGFDSGLIIRGMEGGVIPSLRKAGTMVYYHDMGPEQSIEVSPSDLGIQQDIASAAIPEDIPKASKKKDEIAADIDVDAVAKVAAEEGIKALQGEKGPTRDGLIYSAALCLWHVKKYDTLSASAQAVKEVLDSGKAHSRLGIDK
ncbi:MAG: hypothetical protein IEMM0008_1733 [bacterium]|nr:MAG: hypothetical protein IEMM0008_1733 [bacterium]